MRCAETYGKARALPLLTPLLAVLLAAAPFAASFATDSTGFTCTKDSTDCDEDYFKTQVRCCNPGEDCPDNKGKGKDTGVFGTMAPCPVHDKPQPMRDTPRYSFIGQTVANGDSTAQDSTFSPYLYVYALDPDSKQPYTGVMYRGTPGDTASTFSMIGVDPTSSGGQSSSSSGAQGSSTSSGGDGASSPDTNLQHIANCVQEIDTQTSLQGCQPSGNDPGGSGCADAAKMIRLQLDNCTNQYILQASAYPFQNEDSMALSLENKDDASARTNGYTHCQPLTISKGTDNEYSAGYYLNEAWIKLLQNPSHDTKDPTDQQKPLTQPKLPDGITLKNTDKMTPPPSLKSVTLQSIYTYNYEGIRDPSHPYSPRWDFEGNDRQMYSPKTTDYTVDKNATTLKNSVFCAGIQEDTNFASDKWKDDMATCPSQPSSSGGGDSYDQNTMRRSMRVDVVAWRKCAFEGSLTQPKCLVDKSATPKPGMLDRIAWNKACYADTYNRVGTIPDIMMDPKAFCYQITGINTAKAIPCWQCFEPMPKQKVNYTTVKQPPCSTEYDKSDLTIRPPYLPAMGNWLNPTANCRKDMLNADNGYSAASLCQALRKPYRNLNPLKMRYHNPLDKANDQLPQGAPEGYTFREYFCDHMPYPALLDTGRSLQKNSKDTEQDAKDSYGQWTAIVGVGREGDPGSGQSSSSSGGDQTQKEERCLYGGWGGSGLDKNEGWSSQKSVSLPNASIKLPDPITSWTELKLYQARTLRSDHLNCLGRYEKVFKPGSSEGMSMLAMGSEFSTAIVTQCSQNSPDAPCTYSAAGDTDSSSSSSGGKKLTNLLHEAAPRNWRGYLTAKDASNQQFPNLNKAASTITDLDKAECGDIVLLPQGAENAKTNMGLPKVGIVSMVNLPDKKSCNSTEKSNCADAKNCYIKVVEADNGKWPDACGTTSNWNEMKGRIYYKEGMMPAASTGEYGRVKWTTSCDDPGNYACELKDQQWHAIKLYRIKDDKRQGSSS